MPDPISITILIVAIVNAFVAIFSSIQHDTFMSSCCGNSDGSSCWTVKNDFEGKTDK